MAFIKDYYSEQLGTTIPKCYWKIETPNGMVGSKLNLRVRLNCFKNKKAADTNQNKLCNFDFEFIPNIKSKDNIFAQAYIYAKTLPRFKGAVDA